MRETLRRFHDSLRTAESYLMGCRQFVAFHGGRFPMKLGAPDITAFRNHLATARKVAASAQNQALCAGLFLYREVLNQELGKFEGLTRAPHKLPLHPSPAHLHPKLTRIYACRL